MHMYERLGQSFHEMRGPINRRIYMNADIKEYAKIALGCLAIFYFGLCILGMNPV